MRCNSLQYSHSHLSQPADRQQCHPSFIAPCAAEMAVFLCIGLVFCTKKKRNRSPTHEQRTESEKENGMDTVTVRCVRYDDDGKFTPPLT